MSGFTEYFVNKVMDHALGGVAWTPPAVYYVKVHVGYPGSTGTEFPSATTTRQPLTLSTSSGGQVAANVDIHWTSVAREQISWLSVWTTAGPTGGECIATIELDQATNFYTGDTIELPTLTLQILAGA